ncbi:MAG TPA: calcium-binding protein [Actinomycetota bacterium]|nr:calcium-binding protein [Actinomycetota bacterium]
MTRLRARRQGALAAAAVLVAASAYAGPGAASPGRGRTCLGERVTIAGTADADRLEGTDGRDVISGLDGDDVILGGDGNDRICGGPGADALDGRYGADRIDGGDGDDDADGGPGRDLVLGGRGRDSLTGGDGGTGDTLVGGKGLDFLQGGDGRHDSDWLFGGEGNDRMDGGLGGEDRLYGGTGNDYLTDGLVSFELAAAGVTVDMTRTTGAHARGEGTDSFSAVSGVVGSDHDDVLTGGGARDVFRGRGGDDVIHTGAGFDRVDGGAGADELDGGPDVDLLSYDDSPVGVTASLRDGGGQDTAADSIAGFEDVEGSHFDDVLTGDDSANRLFGSYGSDSIFAGAGDDYLELAGAGDAGSGVDECIWAFEVANCERQGHFDPPSLPYVSEPVQGEELRRLASVSGGIAGGVGGPPRAEIVVGIRRITTEGCWWWDAGESAFVRGHCGKLLPNEVRIERGRWKLPVGVTLHPGVYLVSARWRTVGYGECSGAFAPMCVELDVD